jgi:hypothetical protein
LKRFEFQNFLKVTVSSLVLLVDNGTHEHGRIEEATRGGKTATVAGKGSRKTSVGSRKTATVAGKGSRKTATVAGKSSVGSRKTATVGSGSRKTKTRGAIEKQKSDGA